MFSNPIDIDTTDNLNAPVDILNYTTAEIEMNHFYGELSNLFVSLINLNTIKSPVTYIIIDGKLKVIVDDTPPKAKVPNYRSRFFEIT